MSFDSRRTSFNSEACPDYVLDLSMMMVQSYGPVPAPSLQESAKPLTAHQVSRQVSQKMSNVENLKVCLSSPDQKVTDLEGFKSFLSSPEAVCGLDVENLISLRRKLAAAQEPQCYTSQMRGPVYDTILPLAPATGSWYTTRGLLPQTAATLRKTCQ